MKLNSRLPMAAGLGVAAVAIIAMAPTYLPAWLVARLPSFVPTYGREIDVEDSGGARVDYQVNEVALKQAVLADARKRVIDALNDAQIGGDASLTGDRIYVRITDPQNTDRAVELLGRPSALGIGEFGIERMGDAFILLSPQDLLTFDEATAKSQAALARRVKAMNLRFATVTIPSAGRIRVDAPGLDDVEGLNRKLIAVDAKGAALPAPLTILHKRIVKPD